MLCKSITIGNKIIPYNILPAPMCGVMDAPFREIISEFGTPTLTSEMIASHVTIIKEKDEYFYRAIKRPKNTNIFYSVQMAGCDPEIMSIAAKKIQDIGADAIDINFGCPIKKIVNSMSGSAIMKDPNLAYKILEKVVNSVKIPVTVKMRMGWDFNNLNAPEIAKQAENIGVKMITIHCRTRSQMYSGNADWKFAKKLKEILKIPLIINGDIKNENDILSAVNDSGADGVMIGRGLYGKPWLINEMYSKINKIPFKIPNLQDVIKKHISYIQDHYDSIGAINFSKKHLMFYSKGLPNSNEIRHKIGKAENINEINEIINCFATL